MKKRDQKRVNRIKRLVILCAICAVILSVATYAWFIGMKTVNVSSFDVSIAATDSLSLSLDGITWSDTVSIASDTFNVATYPSNTNSWGGTGLIPISSVGVIDGTSSNLIMYEKGSLTATPGGYRLMASQVRNTTSSTKTVDQNSYTVYPEANGYVAFDLFVKNLSGKAYYAENNVLNEEAIYLTPESEVTVAENGGVAGTGIENSVRVAFAQIGRVISTTDGTTSEGKTTIQGINCSGGTGVTSICSRTAQIWEPNDKDHVANAINWYDESCKKRTGADLTLSSSYTLTGDNSTCEAVANGTYSNTYAVSGVIDYSDRVDVYDGTDYNGYTNSISATPAAGKLMAYNYFTDTEKNLQGVNRPELITLAPNSITKVRVYIWIEGQDVDNYDFASLGRKISVAFGLTKERFYGSDIDYSNDNIYEVTKDSTPVSTKQYYTKNENGTYTATDKPLGSFTQNTTYYEKQNLSDTNSNAGNNNDYFNTNPNYTP